MVKKRRKRKKIKYKRIFNQMGIHKPMLTKK
jgi:hypothetical protein